MTARPWCAGQVGLVRSGRYAGRFLQVEADGGGFHLWFSERHPSDGPSHTWDAWADDADAVDQWLQQELHHVEWLHDG